eukprot:scaffold78201_cov42-Prasinocladus_malaysianus.AAC.1
MLSHWEASHVHNDVMLALALDIERQQFGPLTMALIDDTGWYNANWDAVMDVTFDMVATGRSDPRQRRRLLVPDTELLSLRERQPLDGRAVPCRQLHAAMHGRPALAFHLSGGEDDAVHRPGTPTRPYSFYTYIPMKGP